MCALLWLRFAIIHIIDMHVFVTAYDAFDSYISHISLIYVMNIHVYI